MSQWLRSRIFRKILLYILAVALVPLAVLGTLTLRNTDEAGSAAIARSREALDAKAKEVLELRAVETASHISGFLRERDAHLRKASLLPRTSQAYLAFYDSHLIAHPTDFLDLGLSQDSQPLRDASKPDEIGVLPVRLDKLGFANENLASIPARTAKGEAGSIQYSWAGVDKFVAYAPIPYFGAAYPPPAGFGWVGTGANVAAFHQAAASVGDALEAKNRSLFTATVAILLLTILAVMVIAGVLARHISEPIRRLTDAVRAVEFGDFESGHLTSRMSHEIRTPMNAGMGSLSILPFWTCKCQKWRV